MSLREASYPKTGNPKTGSYCGNGCGLHEPLGLRGTLFEYRNKAITRAVEMRTGVLRKVLGRVPDSFVERMAPERQPTKLTWWWIPQCRIYLCTYGQSASDEQMVRALSYLKELVDDEDYRMMWPTVGVLATRISRAHLARTGRNLPDMTRIPDEPEATAETVFRRSWPWHLPEAEHTGEAVLASEWFWSSYNRYYFEPNGIPF